MAEGAAPVAALLLLASVSENEDELISGIAVPFVKNKGRPQGAAR
jgi:hypothetical protein